MSPALVGGFLTTVPPGKSLNFNIMVLNLLGKQVSSHKPPLIHFYVSLFVVLILRRIDIIAWYEKFL